jgi:hypothetical protein
MSPGYSKSHRADGERDIITFPEGLNSLNALPPMYWYDAMTPALANPICVRVTVQRQFSRRFPPPEWHARIIVPYVASGTAF